MGWLMGLEPKRPGNLGCTEGHLSEESMTLDAPAFPKFMPGLCPGIRQSS